MTHLRQRMIDDMQLRGFAEKTQDAYLRSVRQLAEHYNKPPDQITEEELRDYFLYLKNVKKVSGSTCTLALCGIKFFYQNTIQRDWPALELVRPAREKKLPVVLSVEEVQRILNCVRRQDYRICLSAIYACGLRLKEGVHLQVADLDSERMQLHVKKGKGGKDRYVPMPERILLALRQHWRTHRHPKWLFPGQIALGAPLEQAKKPRCMSSVQRAFKAALKESGVKKEATVHTLRHSYATHLLEAGVSIRLIQAYLGHSSMRSTMIYTHLTRKVEIPAVEAIEKTLEGLWL
jgi:integrase/recombinase XerD